MKFTATSLLLAASSVFASRFVERDNFLQVSELRATASNSSAASMHFVVTDPNYPDDTPTDCNLNWTYGGKPEIGATCDNGQYYVRFPGGAVDFHKFILELERVSGPIQENGFVVVTSGTEWSCMEKPEEGIRFDCSYDGILAIPV
ncbi:hypothetical protein N7457_007678 [Penicillium paradoxum]|uniref:uncharacterized protein n=1 Tax=Penicillium paradoxum TaxID=176176 RepID=UPI00254948E0|nr:uncharacterized protein N7457_007678 [Penicillium paradoxum]KAJ5772782.1 hypothetical protein N7457_007678 [Penicillium paradoxum]